MDIAPGFDGVLALYPTLNATAHDVDLIVRVLEESPSGGAYAGRLQRTPRV